MARKKKTYRQKMLELYELAVSSAKKAFERWGININIPSPEYKESRKRNYYSYTNKVSRKLDELDERIEVQRQAEEQQRYKEYLEEHSDCAKEGHIYMSWELALYHNYMTRLYYYQFIPAVKALIDTIEGDDDIQELIILALSGNNNRLPLPELKQVGYYEEGMNVYSQVQDFLNSTTKEQLIDEAYQQDISKL